MEVVSLIIWLFSLILVYFSYSIFCLSLNYRIASKIGVPLVIIPVSPENPFWMLFGNKIASLIQSIFGESHFTRFAIRGWVYYDKSRVALELGGCFAFVTPDKIWFYVCDREVLNDVVQRRNDFPRPLELLSMLAPFGPNVATVEGAEWQRQRKATSSPFNEENSNLVWKESIRQAQDVLQYWTSQAEPIYETASHVRILSLHVLSYAGFGKSYSFHKAAEPPKPGHLYNYKDSLAMILDHIMVILVVGPRLLTNKYLPRRWSKIGHAILDFKAYMKDMYNEEKKSMTNEEPQAANIMRSLIRASGAEMPEKVVEGGSLLKNSWSKGLTEDEIYGNTFVYNFAGHDTTAITLGWTMYLLAANPHIQEWIAEEIDEYVSGQDVSNVEYSEIFQKLKRCYAVLLEVLRLQNPLPGIIKSTGTSPTSVNLANQQLHLPAGIRVILNTDAIHTHPAYWGADALQWQPQRWIIAHEDGPSSLFNEAILTPLQGAYAPWSGGARVCPGKKFGQVEFVAIMATLFQNYRVEPVPVGAESMESARSRAAAAVRDSGMILLLQMRHPEAVGLRWVRKT